MRIAVLPFNFSSTRSDASDTATSGCTESGFRRFSLRRSGKPGQNAGIRPKHVIAIRQRRSTSPELSIEHHAPRTPSIQVCIPLSGTCNLTSPTSPDHGGDSRMSVFRDHRRQDHARKGNNAGAAIDSAGAFGIAGVYRCSIEARDCCATGAGAGYCPCRKQTRRRHCAPNRRLRAFRTAD